MAEEIQRLLECPMCLELFNSVSRWPKLLPCQHTLCLECMEMLNQGNRIQCPQCRQEHSCPGDGPQQLPNNFTMLALLDVQRKSGTPGGPPGQMKATEMPPLPPKPETSQRPAINEGVRNSIALLARKLQEKSVELSKIDQKEKSTEELFLSVKNKVDGAFQTRTQELQARRDQVIKQLASARQEELAFLQGQRASAFQYLQKLQTDFAKMRQSFMSASEPNEADLINLLSLCRGYLAQIEHYALNIDQRICSVSFADPNQQQLSVSIQAYGCLNISTDKTKSVQPVRTVATPYQASPATQSSPSNPFSPGNTEPVATSSTSSFTPSALPHSSSASSLSGGNGTVSPLTSVSPSTIVAPAPMPTSSDTQDQRLFAVAGHRSRPSRRRSEPVGMSCPSTASLTQPIPSQHLQPVFSSGTPSQAQSSRQSGVTRQMSLDSLATSLPAASSNSQASPAGGEQPPPVPRRPASVRLGSILEGSSSERPSSMILRQNTASADLAHSRGDAPPLPPRMNVHIPSHNGGRQAPPPASQQQSSATNGSQHLQWVKFGSAIPAGSNKNSQASKQRAFVIGQVFEKPSGVHVLDKLNNCFAIVDEHQHCVMILNEEGKLLSKVGSRGGALGQLQFPKGICANSSGNLIITDFNNHRVQIWDLRGRFLKQFGSHGTGNSNFNGPLGVVCDKQDNIYVCDYNNGCVKVFNQAGEFCRQIGKKGERDGQFRNPCNIAFTQGGELLITDAFKHCVQVFSSQGTYLYRFGSWGTAPGDLNCPGGIAVDGQGYIYVANSGNHRIEVFNPSGSYALTLGRHGSEDGQFDEPLGVSISKDGRLLVSDSGNRRLQLVWP